MTDILSDQWNSGIGEECLEFRDVEVTVNWEGFLAADHKRVWALHSSYIPIHQGLNLLTTLPRFLGCFHGPEYQHE